MEILYKNLEQLLKDFSSLFLKELLHSDIYNQTGNIPEQMQKAYFDFIDQFLTLQNDIEHFSALNQSETREKKRALLLLKKSSSMIFNTFALKAS